MCYLCILLLHGYIKEKTHPSCCGPRRVKCWFVPCSAWSIKVLDADSCMRNKQEYFSDMRPAKRISRLHLHPWVLIQRNEPYCRVATQIKLKDSTVHLLVFPMPDFSNKKVSPAFTNTKYVCNRHPLPWPLLRECRKTLITAKWNCFFCGLLLCIWQQLATCKWLRHVQ